MKSINVKTYQPKLSEIAHAWHLVDAAGMTLGRLSSEVANLIRGKHKPTFVPHLDSGDHVVVINAEQIVVTGDRANQKMYRRHSNYPGGFREVVYKDLMATHPERIIENAVKGMVPRNRLGNAQLGKLHVYAGPSHPHGGQTPVPYVFNERQHGNRQAGQKES